MTSRKYFQFNYCARLLIIGASPFIASLFFLLYLLLFNNGAGGDPFSLMLVSIISYALLLVTNLPILFYIWVKISVERVKLETPMSYLVRSSLIFCLSPAIYCFIILPLVIFLGI